MVCINPAYRLYELEYALNKVGCRALITETQFKSSDYIEMMQSLAPELKTATPGELQSRRLPDLRVVIHLGDGWTPGMFRLAEIIQLADKRSYEHLDEIAGVLDFDTPINIQFTSGTTGLPKGATLTHYNILNNAYFVGFAGFGEVAPDFGGFGEEFLPAGGAGLRFVLSEKHRMSLSADIAVGKHGAEFYVGVGEAF